jgi:hypothetical protein
MILLHYILRQTLASSVLTRAKGKVKLNAILSPHAYLYKQSDAVSIACLTICAGSEIPLAACEFFLVVASLIGSDVYSEARNTLACAFNEFLTCDVCVIKESAWFFVSRVCEILHVLTTSVTTILKGTCYLGKALLLARFHFDLLLQACMVLHSFLLFQQRRILTISIWIDTAIEASPVASCPHSVFLVAASILLVLRGEGNTVYCKSRALAFT